MNHLIIWSKDRACQLHLLLASIYRNANNIFDKISIIYTYSNNEYKLGYDLVGSCFLTQNWVLESDFRQDTLRLMEEGDYIAFSTDDTVIFSQMPKNPVLDESRVFSLRLGYNTIIQDPHINSVQPELFEETNDDGILTWDHAHYHPMCNYGYPMSLDMHIFPQKKLFDACNSGKKWYNTNSLETYLQAYEIRRQFPYLSSYEHSIAVNIPCNNMSHVTRSGETYEYSMEFLNEQYLSGRTISLPHIESQTINGCHQELRLELV